MDLIILIILAVLLLSIVRAATSLAPWLPTYKRNLKQINKAIDLQSGDRFLEMGCGNARVASFIARSNPQVEVVGIELASILFIISWLRVKFSKNKNLKIIYGDALKMDISNFDVIYVFGMTHSVNDKLRAKLWAEMKSGARVISYIFPIEDWPGVSQQITDEKKGFKIHIYSK